MNGAKIKRLNRIKFLEERNLDQVVLKLKQTNQSLAECERLQNRVRSNHVAAMSQSATAAASIQQLESLSLLANSVNSRSAEIQKLMRELSQCRAELLDELAACRSKIKGWQTLIEKLQREDRDFYAKASILEADDRVLRDVATKGSNR